LVEVLTVAGCPNRDPAIALVHRICAQLDNPVDVRVVDIPDQQAAEAARFLGSPTIRVDGHDVEPGADRYVEYICECRLYQGKYSLRGLPEEAWVRQALQDTQALRQELDVAALAAEAAMFLDQDAVVDGIGAKLNRLLFSFLEAEVLPQELEALAAEVKTFLEQVPVGEGIAVKLSNVLLGFLQIEVLPEARRESDQGVDPTPLFAVVTGVLRQYADAIERPKGAGH
jgi:hypothetical protein